MVMLGKTRIAADGFEGLHNGAKLKKPPCRLDITKYWFSQTATISLPHCPVGIRCSLVDIHREKPEELPLIAIAMHRTGVMA